MTAANYPACLAITLDFEGGYSNDAGDPGGPTKYGITIYDVRRYLNPRARASDVKALTLEQAKTIYEKHYWQPIWGDELPKGVDLAVFDYGVNSGISRAVKVLQGIVGSPADGVIGSKTIAAVNAYCYAVGKSAELVGCICDQRLGFLRHLPTWSRFGRGWGRREAAVKKLGMAMANNEVAR